MESEAHRWNLSSAAAAAWPHRPPRESPFLVFLSRKGLNGPPWMGLRFVEEILFGVHSAVFPFGLNLSGR